jgi:hypothetical protein
VKFHVCQGIRGALWERRFGDFQQDNGDPMRPTEAFNALCDELAKGHEVIAHSECDNFDPIKGCLGHPETLTETLDELSSRNAPSNLSETAFTDRHGVQGDPATRIHETAAVEQLEGAT